MWYPKLLRTSASCVLERLGSDTRVASSIASFHHSCSREVTSLRETEQVARASMVRNSQMRTSSSSTLDLGSYQWQTQDQIPMDLSSSFALSRLPGLMESTACSDLLWMAWMWSRLSRAMGPKLERQQNRSRLKTVDSFEEFLIHEHPLPSIHQ